jgi:hypothetical protein
MTRSSVIVDGTSSTFRNSQLDGFLKIPGGTLSRRPARGAVDHHLSPAALGATVDHWFTKLVAFTVPIPVPKSQPVVVGYAG